MDKRVRRVGRRVLTVYKENQHEVSKVENRSDVRCTKGCNHCCSRVVLATLPEGLNIAERLMTEPDFRGRLPAMMRALYAQVRFLETNPADASVNCAFLKENDGTCAIYKYRPAMCRYLFVTSDPDNCKPDSTDPVSMIDMRDLDQRVWSEGDRVSKQVGVPFRLIAPLPVVILWGMKILQEGVQGFIESLPTLGSGLQPHYWRNRLVAVRDGGEEDTIERPEGEDDKEVFEKMIREEMEKEADGNPSQQTSPSEEP